TAQNLGYEMKILEAVEEVNEFQKKILFEKLMKYYDNDIKGKTIAVWGLAFKPKTDDMREAPSLVIIDKILEAGGKVKAYDPVAMEEAKRILGDSITYAKDIYDATLEADAILMVTEWNEFRLPTWEVIKKTMKKPVVFDGRNIYNKQEMNEIGFDYFGIGIK
ncbi:MAG: UDP-glucose/GDP-mannose dehydrogenase family protein, partial [Dysgonomonas mossii]